MRPRIILAVDDSPTIRKVVQVVLARQGHEVHVAADGEEGLRVGEELRPDLILLDFVMPRMNGYQFCRAMAQSDVLREVPVVLMSAKGDQVGERFVRVMGIVDYINKPFSPEALTAVVTHSIEKYGGRKGDSIERTPIDWADEETSGVTDTNPGSVPRYVENPDTGRITAPLPDVEKTTGTVDTDALRARAIETIR